MKNDIVTNVLKNNILFVVQSDAYDAFSIASKINIHTCFENLSNKELFSMFSDVCFSNLMINEPDKLVFLLQEVANRYCVRNKIFNVKIEVSNEVKCGKYGFCNITLNASDFNDEFDPFKYCYGIRTLDTLIHELTHHKRYIQSNRLLFPSLNQNNIKQPSEHDIFISSIILENTFFRYYMNAKKLFGNDEEYKQIKDSFQLYKDFEKSYFIPEIDASVNALKAIQQLYNKNIFKKQEYYDYLAYTQLHLPSYSVNNQKETNIENNKNFFLLLRNGRRAIKSKKINDLLDNIETKYNLDMELINYYKIYSPIINDMIKAMSYNDKNIDLMVK